ncbi:hypothetical protein LUZ60_004916 [Juncus effusus]|nr:hypothetical protein LUZ60_004916 [Juncus effusus]
MEAVRIHSLRAPLFNPMAMAARKLSTRVDATKRGTTVFPVGEPGPRQLSTATSPIKLLTNVEKLRLLSKAEKAGLLSLAENLGFSLSTVERLGLLSKAEELGVLSAVTDPSLPSGILLASLVLLGLGPVCVFVVPESSPVEIAVQVAVVALSLVGGSTGFAAYSFVSKLQNSS